MNFRLWLEMGNLAARSTDHITFYKNHNHNIASNFEYGGQTFTVTFSKASESATPDSYEIGFTGINGHSQTNTAGYGSHAIYANVLLVIKKFLETYTVNEIQFSGYSYNMDIIYHKFFKQYLQKDFMQTSQSTYVRKSYLRKILQNDPNRKDVYGTIINNNRLWLYSLKKASDRKNHTRNNKLYFKNKNHTFAYYIDEEQQHKTVIYIYQINKDSVSAFFDMKPVFMTDISYSNLDTTPVSEPEIQNFLRKIVKSDDGKWFLQQEAGEPLRKILKTYNIPNTF